MHPNARLIERLYTSLAAHDAEAAAACYAPDARFEDIGFRLESREDIRNMWRMVCDVREAKVEVSDFHADFADDERGRGHWTARYRFRILFPPGRPVVNNSVSEFVFRRGEILRHEDSSDPLTWAKQAYPFPLSFLVGRIETLRRLGAKAKLRKFLGKRTDMVAGPG